jgi:hypothetical protein
MIEIREISEDKKTRQQYKLFIDGTVVEEVLIYGYGVDDRRFHVYTSADYATERLSAYSLSEISMKGVIDLRLKCSFDWLEVLSQLWIQMNEKEGSYSILFMLNRLSVWQREYSFAEYYEQLIQIIKESKEPNIITNDDKDSDIDFSSILPTEFFVIKFSSCQVELRLSDEITRCSNILRNFHDQVEKALSPRAQSNSVVMSFDFPEEVRVPCEQYLLYFVQFLKDLGVEATAQLQHNAGQVLFAVTPTDKQTALDKIRTALEAYLQLSSNPVNDASIVGYEIAAQRLAANIDHLTGQLRLAHAELQLAEATKQTQQVTINNLLSGQIIIESMKDVTPKPREDKEELLDGTVALTKFNWKGVEFNLPEIFRRLRQMFREDE